MEPFLLLNNSEINHDLIFVLKVAYFQTSFLLFEVHFLLLGLLYGETARETTYISRATYFCKTVVPDH